MQTHDYPKGKLLVVTHYFAPKNEIASVRIVNFAVGLTELGWDVDVLAVGPNTFNPLERRLDFEYPEERLRKVRVVEVSPPWEAKALYAIRGILRTLFGLPGKVRRRADGPLGEAEKPPSAPDGRSVARGPLKRLLDSVLDRGYRRVFSRASGLASGYDAIWTSFGPRVMVDVGLDMSRRFPSAAFVMDVRDPLVRPSLARDAREVSDQKARETRLARSSVDALSLVSEYFIEDPASFRAPIATIPNGFDVTLAVWPRPQKQVERPLTVYYGGRLYPAQDVRPLAAACLAVSQSRAVRVEYAGPDAAEFVEAFASQGADHLVQDLGVLSRGDSLRHAREADVVTVFSWNTTERGILTGKVFELIAIDTPIAVVVAGDHATSALAEMFEGDRLRRVFGDSLGSEAIDELADFIRGARDIPEEVRAGWRGVEKYREYSHPVIVQRLSQCLEDAVARRRRV